MRLECEKKVTWPTMHFFMNTLIHMMNIYLRIEEKLKKKRRHILSSWIKEDKLIGDDFRQRIVTKEEVYFCELEKGSFLGEEDDGDFEERSIESLMDY
jgi:hypothetical protein